MSVFLPLLDGNADNALLQALARIGPVVVPASQKSIAPENASRYILVDSDSPDVEKVASWLDQGAEKVIIPLSWAKEIIGVLPAERLLLLLDVANVSAVSDKIRNGVSGVLIKAPSVDADFVASVSRFFSDSAVHVLPQQRMRPRRVLAFARFRVPINVADAFLSSITSDRPDGLFPTVISSHLEGDVRSGSFTRPWSLCGRALQQERVCISLASMAYGARERRPRRPARRRILSPQQGVVFRGEERVVCSRKHPEISTCISPEGSYTSRLFNDPNLLRAKIMEEADELCSAESKEEVSFEAADLFYFALARCVRAGVGIADIERSLDKKAKKVTRRPAPTQDTGKKPADPEAPIRMRSFDLSVPTTGEERARLLRRPVLKSDEMIAKVKPIVDDVRTRGDAALIELTAKFDKAQLSSTVIFPPFAPETMQLDASVRDAIDVAYANIHKFHQAQAEQSELVVETMPGVVCSRFSRPIARVGFCGLQGDRACDATTPRWSISPEVMYAAHLVGASAILKAGGAQAVAALAYGTQTVPKVDKIFGPGNQWVTAAKMLVQNDTDALVAIDMPAGPSEVLVSFRVYLRPCALNRRAGHRRPHMQPGVRRGGSAIAGRARRRLAVVLMSVSLSDARIAAIEAEVDAQARALPRVDIVRESIPKSIIVKVASVEDAMRFSNDYAPEHLILHLENASNVVAAVENAGSVFVGPFSPESCGDYASGTNHTLPTNGYARQFSGVNTASFQKHITSQAVTAEGLKVLGPVVATLADCEGLQAHANAVRIRLRAL
ncbi:Histidine biosynthesis trifunctional protein [Grifola frondosa]|uniref:Histidine biosynthesis trifunctional protein n=1 Tax=Grifola frondosa TaxID=5627 RepID=A0A1C7M129_GRIFR|nr:Histidine biosynthesis trifunctional protein [Grifola frondosa]